MTFGYYKDPARVEKTAQAVEKYLLNRSPSGGSPRYEHDQYFAVNPPYMGNPWFVATLWLAQYYVRTKRLDEAKELLDWCAKRTLPSGAMAEQVHPGTGQPRSVAPLVWSHAEFVNTALDLSRAGQPKK